MKRLLRQLAPAPSVLLWVSDIAPPSPTRRGELAHDPLLVDSEMIAAIRPAASAYVEAVISAEARSQGVEGMAFAAMEAPAAAGVLGPAAHQEVADALCPVLHSLI
jgi:hypothetical protein